MTKRLTAKQEIYSLHAFGPAYLSYNDKKVKLRRKSLALLYYLACEGPTRRERLADLLWEGSGGLQNLRVELSDLRKALSASDVPTFESAEDPLKLPGVIRLDMTLKTNGLSETREPLEGLDDISHGFQTWLEWKRHHLLEESFQSPYQALLDELVGQISAPLLLVVEALPGDSALQFATDLAARLRLPLHTHIPKEARGLVYISEPYPENLLEQIKEDDKQIWLVNRPFFGEDSQALLELRAKLPIAHSRYITLKNMAWPASRSSLFSDLPFARAARLQVLSQGHPGFIQEMLNLPDGLRGNRRTPRRFLAALQLATRKLPIRARQALERLSVHPGYLDRKTLSLLEARPYLEELERQRWLNYNEAGWHFSSDLLRTTLYETLPRGYRNTYHLKLAHGSAQEVKSLSSFYHLCMADKDPNPLEILPLLPLWGRFAFSRWCGKRISRRAPDENTVGCGNELFLEKRHFRENAFTERKNSLWIERDPLTTEPNLITWTAPRQPFLLRLKGHAFTDNALGVGINAQAVPMRLTVKGNAKEVVFIPNIEPAWTPSQIFLPLNDAFDYWLFVQAASEVSLESRAEKCVIQIDVKCFALDEALLQPVTAYPL